LGKEQEVVDIDLLIGMDDEAKRELLALFQVTPLSAFISAYLKLEPKVENGVRDLVVVEEDLEDVNFSGCDLSGSSFVDCRFIRVNFDRAVLNSSSFKKCEFISCGFRAANSERVEFNECEFLDVDFSEATFVSSKFKGGRLKNVEWNDTKFKDTTFENGLEGKPFRVLVVEDQLKSLVWTMEELLRCFPNRLVLTFAKSANSAKEQISTHDFDFGIVDLLIPRTELIGKEEMLGPEIVRQIAEQPAPRSFPCVIFTHHKSMLKEIRPSLDGETFLGAIEKQEHDEISALFDDLQKRFDAESIAA
jgi:CheY-like chemotaxis protein